MLKINGFLMFLLAPFLAIFIVMNQTNISVESLGIDTAQIMKTVNETKIEKDKLEQGIENLGLVIRIQEQVFSRQNSTLKRLAEQSGEFAALSEDIYEQKILDVLGPAVAYNKSENNEIKIFSLNELGYRGYIAKIKLFNPESFKVVLAKDELGNIETTADAAERTNAIFAVNGGGFYYEETDEGKKPRLIGNTIIDGELVEPFNGYPGTLFFAGINKNGEVVGTVPQTEDDIMDLDPLQGVSFIPVLLEDSEKKEIPAEWIETNQPRTIIGKYANDDLIFIVVDGRQNKWSAGVSLERLQDKLLELGVKSAYNLDGGGSSTMYFDGEVVNKPSDGGERRVINNIIITE